MHHEQLRVHRLEAGEDSLEVMTGVVLATDCKH